ncbi:MAG TPA: acetylornithine transaminase [Fibrobacteraceae bacterium]|nr:acetylornithine transaminase [Fibrobacteraceae bacterium]
MEPSSAKLIDQDHLYLASTYARADIEFVRGEGSWLYTADGRKVLDFVSGISVNALGHAHPAVIQAVSNQVRSYTHLSNLYPNAPQIALAKRMLELTGWGAQGGKAFFCNSGAEANEGAIKFARKYFVRKDRPERQQIVTIQSSFHGRTFGAMAATGQDSIKQGFGPIPTGFVHVPLNDVGELKRVVNHQTCAVMIEPLIAEGGILLSSPEYVSAMNALREEFGFLIIADEIQCGFGRCGSISASQRYGMHADLTTWAKALGGGLPLGMVLMSKAVAEQLKPGDHGTTFGGNPVACSAGLAVLDILSAPAFLEQVKQRSVQMRNGLQGIAQKFSWLDEVRGDGLLLGMVSRKPVADLVAACRSCDLLVHRAGSNVLRLLPPLNVSEQEVEQGLARIQDACALL